MRSYPVDAEHCADCLTDAKFLSQLALCGVHRRFVGLGHAPRQIPIWLVFRVDDQDSAQGVSNQYVTPDSLSGLLAGPSIKIPGGEVVHFTINDEDFVSTAQQTHALHVFALNLYKQRTLDGP